MKIRKQGNALVLTVPTNFNLQAGQEFIAIKGELGSVTFVPKIGNIFKDALDKGHSLRFNCEFIDDSQIVGREVI